jgi:hypothetical protein
VDCSIIADLRLYPMISKDSLRLTDPQLAIEELGHFKAAGGRTLIDQTSFAPFPGIQSGWLRSGSLSPPDISAGFSSRRMSA